MISIRRFTFQDFDAVQEFYSRAIEGDIDRRIEAFRWIQMHNPFHNPFKDVNNNYLLGFSNDKLIGYSGIMRVRFYHFGRPFYALFSQETLVDPSYRRHGLATKLLAEVNRSDSFLVSLWHNERILALLGKKGWINIGSFRPLKKIHKLESLKKLSHAQHFRPEW